MGTVNNVQLVTQGDYWGPFFVVRMLRSLKTFPMRTCVIMGILKNKPRQWLCFVAELRTRSALRVFTSSPTTDGVEANVINE